MSDQLRSGQLYATGLGLMICNESVAQRLVEGRDYLASETVSPELQQIIDAKELVMLGTGSPQLWYSIECRVGNPPVSSDEKVMATFGLLAAGGEIVVRDGYDLMEWSRTTSNCFRFALSDGWYRVTASCSRSIRDPIALNLAFEASTKPIRDGDGWPYLDLLGVRLLPS